MFTLCGMSTNTELQTYTIAFEHVLQKVATGLPLSTTLREYHTQIDPSLFRTWIYRDESRKKAWLVAKALSAEVMEEDILRISDGLDPDGNPSPNDINRAQLQISTRKWLMQVNNKKRYGDTKFIETTNTNDTNLTTEELERRILEQIGVDIN